MLLTFLAAASPALAQSAADLEEGAALYAEHCAACHGADLKGQPDWRSRNADGTMRAPPHDDTGHTWHHGDRLLTDYVRLGGAEALARRGVEGVASGMPGFDGVLSDDEIARVLLYIKTHWSERARRFQKTATEAEQ